MHVVGIVGISGGWILWMSDGFSWLPNVDSFFWPIGFCAMGAPYFGCSGMRGLGDWRFKGGCTILYY